MFFLRLISFHLLITVYLILLEGKVLGLEIQKEFPASSFFNTTEDSVTRYLCQKRESERKCCSCNPWMSEEERCIDVFWDSAKNDSLNEYIKELESKVNEYTSVNPCLTIIPSENHVTEKYRVKAMFYNKTTKKHQKCKHSLGKKLNPLVWVKDIGLYISKQCALLADENYGRSYEYFNIAVQCKESEELLENMVFDFDMKDKLKECSFQVSPSNDRQFLYEVRSKKCTREISNCEVGHKYHDLCDAYYAPIGGYNNQHCLMCSQNVESMIPLYEECKDLPRTVHFGDDTVIEPLTLYQDGESGLKEKSPLSGIRFDLVANENDEWIIKNLKSSFPASKFLKIIDANMTEIFSNSFLCGSRSNESEIYCDCDAECVKYKTCCVDKFWEISKPVSENEYKSMIKKRMQGHKDLKCETVSPKRSTGGKKYFMVNSCSSTVDNSSRKKCVDRTQSDLLPVLGSDNYLYKNRFCALCNSVKVSMPVHRKYDCVNYGEGRLSNKTVNCNWIITNRSTSIRTCQDIPLNIEKLYRFQSSFYKFDWKSNYVENIEKSSFSKCLSQKSTKVFVICKVSKFESTKDLAHRLLDIFNTTKPVVRVYHEDKHIVIFCIHVLFSISQLNETFNAHDVFKPYAVRESKGRIIFSPGLKSATEVLNGPYNRSRHQNEPCFKDDSISSNSSFFQPICDCIPENVTTDNLWLLFKWSADSEDILSCKRIEAKIMCNDSAGSIFENSSFDTKTSVMKRLESCIWQPKISKRFTDLLKADASLSLISSLVNVTFYLFFIFIYYRLNDIRSMYGICLLSLVMSLLFAEVAHFFAMILRLSGYNDILPVCKLIAVSLHFCLLKTHIWNMIVTYDLLSLSTHLSVKRLRKSTYLMIAFCTTLLLVLFSFLSDQYDVIKIGYGDDRICVPHKFYGQLLFQIIPAFLSTLISIIILRLIFKKIKESSNNDHGSGNKTRVAQLIWKFTILLAVSEVFGYISIKDPTKTKGGMTIYMILNLLYILARSSRAILFFVYFYAFEKGLSKFYKESLHGRVSTVREHIAMWSDSPNETPELPHRQLVDFKFRL